MQKQVHKVTYPSVGLTYFFCLNEVGEKEREIAIPIQAISGSTQGYKGVNPAWGHSVGLDVVAKSSYDMLVNVNPKTDIREINKMFSVLARNGHVCYKEDGGYRAIYLASMGDIAKIADFSDCKIPIVHVLINNVGGIIGITNHAGYITLKPTEISVHFKNNSDGNQALSQLIKSGGVFQIMR